MSLQDSEDVLREAYENTKPVMDAAESLANAAVAGAAKQSGRTADEQLARMADRFAYMAMEQDEQQKQLDDYKLSGPTVPVKA